MGSNKQEKWLKELKNSVQNYSEQLPDDFWEGIQNDMPALRPKRGVVRRLVWITSAAAVLLLALLLVWPQPEEPAGVAVTVVEQPAVNESAVDEPAVGMESFGEGDLEKKRDEAVMEKKVKVMVEEKTVEMKIGEEKIVEEKVGKVENEKIVDEKENMEKDCREENGVPDREEMKKKEREEYLKEMEYLQQDLGKERRGKTLLAFAAGTGGVPINFSGDLYADDLQDVILPPTSSSGGTTNTPVEIENIAGVLNMGVLPTENITWIGKNGPTNLVNNALQSFKSFGYTHNEPVRIGVMFAREVAQGVYVESGISYQYLKSKMGESRDPYVQKLHYLGIPARLRVDVVKSRVFSAYISGGYLLEKCIYGTVESRYNDDFRVYVRKWQNSINANVGAQLNVGGGAFLYLEPGIYKYLGMKGKDLTRQNGYILESIYTEEPTGFSLQGGVRFSF